MAILHMLACMIKIRCRTVLKQTEYYCLEIACLSQLEWLSWPRCPDAVGCERMPDVVIRSARMSRCLALLLHLPPALMSHVGAPALAAAVVQPIRSEWLVVAALTKRPGQKLSLSAVRCRPSVYPRRIKVSFPHQKTNQQGANLLCRQESGDSGWCKFL